MRSRVRLGCGGRVHIVWQDRAVVKLRITSIGFLGAFACACSGNSTAPSYPDVSGTWVGHVTIGLALPNSPGGMIASSAGGQVTGSWQSTPDSALELGAPGCQQSGSLTGTISPSGSISLSFNAILGVTGCTSDNAGDALSGTEALGGISASAQDTIHCPGVPSEPRSLSFSLYKLQ